MAQQDHRYHSGRGDYGRERSRGHFWRDRDEQRGERYPGGTDRDRYETGGERRYQADWDEDSSQRGWSGERSYSAGGYPEEFGYRRERQGREREPLYGRSFEDETRLEPWRRRGFEDERGEEYFGTGSHYGGGYGTAPSTRVSGEGSFGSPGYGGGSAWNERSEWLPETGGTRGTTGREEYYGRPAYGAQSNYGRDLGQSYSSRTSYSGQRTPQGAYGQNYGGSSRYGQQGSYSDSQGWGQSEYQSGARGSFRGRGPKGYTRSDERLREMVCERLTDDPNIDASEITVEVTSQVVTLSGSVDDRRTKYEIEEIVERCGGVKDINNQLRVHSERFGSGATSASTGQRGGDFKPTQGTSQGAGPGANQGTTGATSGTPSPSSSGTSTTRRN